MPRVLIVSTDIVGPAMAGPGIRAWELARALAGEFAVTLAAPPGVRNPDEGRRQDEGGVEGSELREFRLAPYVFGRPGALAEVLADADVVVGQGFVFAEHPELLASSLPLAIDLYDPLLLEALDLYGAQSAEDATMHHRRY
ncbi:MAG TPA: hypothetical protein VGJ87_19605, partial [Roseiflexaceae bacterium]